MEEIDSGVWKALLAGFTSEEKERLTQAVQKELREQRAEVVRAAEEKAAGQAPPRRPGRPRKHRRA
jgi:hypothetical protein